MRMRRIAGIAVTACLVSVAASAQSESRSLQKNDTKQQMTVVGCLVRETDYRRAHGLGKGAFGGLGLGDEFVLVDATAVSAPASTDAATSASSSTAAPCAEKGTGQAYRVTGKSEDELKRFVGRRMEITGPFDHARDARTAAGQTNAKLPPEIKIASYREAPASVSAAPASASTAPAPAVSPAPASVEARNEPSFRGPLPKTASNLPLIGLIGLISLSAAFGLRLWRLGRGTM
jgi:hypothetical protein